VGAAIGTKAAAGLATAALLTAGAAEIKHVSEKDPAPNNKRVATKQSAPAAPKPELKAPAAIVAAAPAAVPPAEAAAAAPPAEEPADEVIVEPLPPEEELTGAPDESGGVLPIRPRKHKHGEPIANTDGSPPGAVGAPVTTGISTGCDADGDGIADPSCSTGTTTGVEETEAPPAPTIVGPLMKLKKSTGTAKRGSSSKASSSKRSGSKSSGSKSTRSKPSRSKPSGSKSKK
jgi:hypothetical protein